MKSVQNSSLQTGISLVACGGSTEKCHSNVGINNLNNLKKIWLRSGDSKVFIPIKNFRDLRSNWKKAVILNTLQYYINKTRVPFSLYSIKDLQRLKVLTERLIKFVCKHQENTRLLHFLYLNKGLWSPINFYRKNYKDYKILEIITYL